MIIKFQNLIIKQKPCGIFISDMQGKEKLKKEIKIVENNIQLCDSTIASNFNNHFTANLMTNNNTHKYFDFLNANVPTIR